MENTYHDIKERILTATSIINYLSMRMDVISVAFADIIHRKQGNSFMEEQVKHTDNLLNAVDMQLTKVVNELAEFCDAHDLTDEEESFIHSQIEFINSKQHEDFLSE